MLRREMMRKKERVLRRGRKRMEKNKEKETKMGEGELETGGLWTSPSLVSVILGAS